MQQAQDIDLATCDLNVVASSVKTLMKEVMEFNAPGVPLIVSSQDNLEVFRGAIRGLSAQADEASQIGSAQTLVASLNDDGRQVLAKLVAHFLQVAVHSAKNLMTLSNISIAVLGPKLMELFLVSEIREATGACNNMALCLLTHAGTLFPAPPVVDATGAHGVVFSHDIEILVLSPSNSVEQQPTSFV